MTLHTDIRSAIETARTDGTVRLSPTSADALADRIVAALANRDINPTITVAPAGPVAVLDAADMVAAIARHAARNAPADEQITFWDNVPHTGPHIDGVRRLAWALQRLFGIWCLSNTSGSYWHIAGRPSDVAAFRSLLGALTDAGAAEDAALPAEDRERFWETLGSVIASTSKGVDAVAAAKGRTETAKTAAKDRWTPQNVPKIDKAADDDPIHARVARTLAAVA